MAKVDNVDYSRTLLDISSTIDVIHTKLLNAKSSSDVGDLYNQMIQIHGIGDTIASKLIKYTLREIGIGNLHPKEIPLSVTWPLVDEYHVNQATKLNLTYVKKELDKVRATIRNWENYDQRYELYTQTASIAWKYKQDRPNLGDQIKQDRRLYLHLYFNSEKAVEDEKKHNLLLISLQQELESGKPKPEHDEDYKKYFEVTKTPVRGIKITPKQEAIDEAKKNYGYFALISNDIKDPIRTLEIYRNKDLVEKAFGNLKERLNLRRTLVSSEQSLDGKLFVEFIALIYLSYIKKKMQDADLFKKYTLQGLLDEFDVIECFEQKGKDRRWGEMTKKQAELFTLMGVNPPSLHVSGI